MNPRNNFHVYGYRLFRKKIEELLVIGIPNLLMNLLSFHGFVKNTNSTLILLCPSQMLKYYFSKGFVFGIKFKSLKEDL